MPAVPLEEEADGDDPDRRPAAGGQLRVTGGPARLGLLLFAVALAAAPAPAAEPSAGRDMSRREALEHKFTFVFRMLHQSAGALRIETGGTAEAKALLAEARGLLETARGEIANGNLQAAEESLNEALRQVGLALRMVQERAGGDERRDLYAAQVEEIQAFQASQLDVLRRVSALPSGAARPPEMEQVGDYVRAAQELAQQNRLDEALGRLRRARQLILDAVPKLMVPPGLESELKFGTPRAEMEYESARSRSYENLLPLALAARVPAPGPMKAIQETIDQARRLQTAARKQAIEGDDGAAAATFRQSSELLQQALDRAGVQLPKQGE